MASKEERREQRRAERLAKANRERRERLQLRLNTYGSVGAGRIHLDKDCAKINDAVTEAMRVVVEVMGRCECDEALALQGMDKLYNARTTLLVALHEKRMAQLSSAGHRPDD